jgi:uncharacterized protein YciI
MARFAVELVFAPDRDKLLATRPAHREYITSLVGKGVVLAGGPFADDAGAMIVYEVADEAALKEIIAADPYTLANVVAEWNIREWNVVLGLWLND